MVSFVSHLKRQEIEHCLTKIDRLKELVKDHPDQKSYISQLKIVNARLQFLLQTSKALNSLEQDLNKIF